MPQQIKSSISNNKFNNSCVPWCAHSFSAVEHLLIVVRHCNSSDVGVTIDHLKLPIWSRENMVISCEYQGPAVANRVNFHKVDRIGSMPGL